MVFPSSPPAGGVAGCCRRAVPDKDRCAEEAMTLITSTCNVSPEELPASGSPDMSVLLGDALSGISIKLP